MLFGADRQQIRRYFAEVWRKRTAGSPLEPLEHIIAGVIENHPEYQSLLSGDDALLGREYPPEFGETNPFLHMGMHIALREQASGDRPAGVLALYERLRRRYGDSHAAEHAMMECLGLTLWEAQRAGVEPDEALYLRRLQRLAQGN